MNESEPRDAPTPGTFSLREAEPWHAFFSHPDYVRFAQMILPPPRTALEISALIRWLGLRRGESVLDLGCGYGRISAGLADGGLRVTGIDACQEMISLARARANKKHELSYYCVDMRDVRFPHASFDAVINLSTAFGYTADEEGEQAVMCGVYDMLRPGGCFVIDTENREHKLRTARRTHFEREGVDIYCDRSFDIHRGRWTEVMTWNGADGSGTSTFDVRLYTFTELRAMLERAGFTVTATYGWFDDSPLHEDSPRMIILAQHP